jgi:amino acid transporter
MPEPQPAPPETAAPDAASPVDPYANPDTPAYPIPQNGDAHFTRALSLKSAIAVNMTQICGIGPFVTIPLMVSTMGGPQALLGWIVGAILAITDGLVWAELGAAMPHAGGTYLYLREAFQYRTGRLMPFLFVWTATIYIPLIMSTGVIGMVQYVGYYFPVLATNPVAGSPDWYKIHLLSVAVVLITTFALYRNIAAISKFTNFLWIIMIISVGGVILASFTHFHASTAFNFPTGAFHLSNRFFAGLGAGLVIAIYDYMGYNTTAYMADELRDPGTVLPKSIIYSILGMMVIYLAMNIGVLGVLPWQDAAHSASVGSDVFEVTWGKTTARIFTALIIITAFGSVFTGLLGGSRVPFNAAKDGLFLRPFARLHPHLNFPHISVVVMCAITAAGTFFDLSDVINMLVALMVLVQCIGQIAALTVLRKRQPTLTRPYKMALYPIPSIIALLGWTYAYIASGWPTIMWSLILLAAGIIAFTVWAAIEKTWPFAPPQIREQFLEAQNGMEGVAS